MTQDDRKAQERAPTRNPAVASAAAQPAAPASSEGWVAEEVEVRGHIVDSLLLPKILDRILQMGGTFEIVDCQIGARRVDPSYARINIRAARNTELDEILGDLVEHGASAVNPGEARFV